MTRHQLDHYESILKKRKADLAAELRLREGIEAEAQPDLFDEIQRAVDRALVIQNLNRNSGMLRKVEAALSRIREGDYGMCLRCDEEISPKRLAAAPWANLCLACQEEADREEREAAETIRLDFAA